MSIYVVIATGHEPGLVCLSVLPVSGGPGLGHHLSFYNIQSICLVRMIEMSVRTPSTTGAGIRAFINVFDEALDLCSKMRNAADVAGLVIRSLERSR